MNRLLKFAGVLAAAGSLALCAQAVQSAHAPQTGKVMREFRGIKLGLKQADVRTALGKTESTSDTKDEFKLGAGDDLMTVHYENGEVNAIQLYFTDAKNAPPFAEVVGDAAITENASGGKTARKVMEAEKFWVAMYQSKDGTITTITIRKS